MAKPPSRYRYSSMEAVEEHTGQREGREGKRERRGEEERGEGRGRYQYSQLKLCRRFRWDHGGFSRAYHSYIS